jgi:DNA-binding response OmpR family regulator
MPQMTEDTTSQTPGSSQRGSGTVTVLVYSDDRATREQVRLAVGRRAAGDLPEIEYLECATSAAVLSELEAGGVDVCVLDGEAAPTGGMGLCRQIKDEIYGCPPMLVLIGRPQDAWLATWSRADAAVPHPIDPVSLSGAVAALLRDFRY